MIHNIAEERKKRNRLEPSFSEPFSDEELLRLIGQVEEKALIHAPVGLKEDIFLQLEAKSQKRKRRRLFSYRAKVLVGMAAALAVLFLMPADRAETAGGTWTELFGIRQEEETAALDEWDQDVLERQLDIDRTWEKYQEGQKRAAVRRQYFEDVTGKLTDYEQWED